MHEIAPFAIPAMRDLYPKTTTLDYHSVVLDSSFLGGVYLAAVSEMVGSTALMQEDIMMAGYASMVGMGLTFAIMFRLKFRFPTKSHSSFLRIAIILANLILHVYPKYTGTGSHLFFFAGIFRMWATFE